ncbi:NUMOD4 domain-containing protein [Limosilactobacillus fermentum]|uniref:NUMOD4 domain-containing protein n=1 Tax=Limosilactobacillus fermentum TaxID=1613 RepID=UPI0014029B4C|nr:NUMOD4 domain-containing protein [Limosilactobacillus fermentum]
MIEIWRKIKSFPNYQISNLGNVKNIVTNRKISQWKKENGYLQVTLHTNGIKRNLYVHRLVAEAFVPNPQKLSDVNHIDEDKSNNCVTNLEWMTHLANCNYGNRGLKISSQLSKPVIQMDLSGNIIQRFPSLISVNKAGFGFGNVANVCLGTKEKAYGYKWKYERRKY